MEACFCHRETFCYYYFILNKGNRNFIHQNCDFTSHDSDFLSPGITSQHEFFFFPSQFRRSLDAAPEIFLIDFYLYLFICIFLKYCYVSFFLLLLFSIPMVAIVAISLLYFMKQNTGDGVRSADDPDSNQTTRVVDPHRGSE